MNFKSLRKIAKFRKAGQRIGKWIIANWRKLIFWPIAIIWWCAAVYKTELWLTAVLMMAAFQQWTAFCKWVEYRAPGKSQRQLYNLHRRYDDLVLLFVLNTPEFQAKFPMYFKQQNKETK